MPAGTYPFAVIFATLAAISVARAKEPWTFAGCNFALPLWLGTLVLIGLGCASLVFGVLNPHTAAMVGLEGIAAP